VLLQASLDSTSRSSERGAKRQVLASKAHLQLVGLAVMGTNQRLGGLEPGARQLFADIVTAVITELGKPSDRYRSHRSDSWIAL